MIESTKSLSLYDLQKKAEQAKLALDSIEFAALLDKEDELSLLREEFHIPKQDDRESIYLVGNSLGLQPKSLKGLLDEELRVWADSAVNGHFDHAYKRPWLTVDEECASHLCNIVGAKEGEVAAMGTLTTNLHLLMCAFYHPTLRRYKIVLEKRAFPSDHYLVESQLKLHGIDPKDGMILVAPREGEDTIQTDDILATLRQHGDSVAIVLFAGVQYYTGQHFDIPTISKAGHEIGAIVGIDLAHAVGNVPLEVHDWNVDFAAWCSYKYLNSGPGAIAGLFVHNRHDQNDNLTILRGWWSHQVSTRFRMDNKFEAIVGAKGFQLSNPDVLSMTALLASLRIFSKTSVKIIRQKTVLLCAYLRYLLTPLVEGPSPRIRIITPEDPKSSGAQLSLLSLGGGVTDIMKKCNEKGLFFDERSPDLIRVAPIGLYNTFRDVHIAATILKEAILSLSSN